MRFLVEVLPPNDESVRGTVRRAEQDEAVSFCGWLELLRLLEPARSSNESQERDERDVVPPRLDARKP